MITPKHWLAFFLAVTFAIAFPKIVYAGNSWYVAPSGDDANDCHSPITPCLTISGAVDRTTSGDKVYIAKGIYKNLAQAVVIDAKNLTLSGGWDAAFGVQNGFSIIDGRNLGPVMMLYNHAVVLADRLIIQHGFAVSGGIGVLSSELTLENSAVLNNVGHSIRVDDGKVNLFNVTISGNTAPLQANRQQAETVVTIKSSTISYNGIDPSSGGGGGIDNQNATVVMQNTILSNNGSDIGADCSGVITSQGYNLVGTVNDCNFSPNTGDLIQANAGLMPFIDELGFYPLAADSFAIDAGNPNGCTDHLNNPLTTDQRGAVRTGRCDIGAYERIAAGSATDVFILSGTPQSTTLGTIFPAPLRSLVVDKFGTPASGAVVTYTAPITGPGGTFAANSTSMVSVTADEDGIASADFVANMVVGQYTVTAGLGSSKADFALTNLLISTTTTISSVTPEPSMMGEPITVTFLVTGLQGIPTGVVTVTVEGAAISCTGELTNGVGACALVLQSGGTYTLRATFGGNTLYLGSEALVQHTVEPSKLYLPTIYKPLLLITGQVTYNGQPASKVPLTLFKDQSSDTMTTTTDIDGKYYFWVGGEMGVDRLPSWRVQFDNPDNDPDFLHVWSTDFYHPANSAAYMVTIPPFDTGTAQLIAPKAGKKQDMPIVFKWKKRVTPGPSERYSVLIFDDRLGPVFGPEWPYPTETDTADCIRSSQPVDLETGTWWIHINTAGGDGNTVARPIKIGKTIKCANAANFTRQWSLSK